MPSKDKQNGVKPSARVGKKDTDKVKRRTPRACDRCRLKKAKCDGTQPCKACKLSDSACMYTARRGREARNYYWLMREITDEALQRLYWACTSGQGFPGVLPTKVDGNITTSAILEALGLIGSPSDGRGMPQPLPRSQPDDQYHRHVMKSTDAHHMRPFTPLSSTAPSAPSVADSSSSSSEESDILVSEAGPNDAPSLPLETSKDMREQFEQQLYYQAQQPFQLSLPRKMLGPHSSQLDKASQDAMHSFIDLDSLLDEEDKSPSSSVLDSSYPPTLFPSIFSNQALLPDPHTLVHPEPHDFPSPWPGTLTAIYSGAPHP